MCPRIRWTVIAGALALAGVVTSGCTSDEWPPLPAEDESSEGDPEESFEGVRLEIVEPASPSIHPLGTPVHLEARVLDPDGVRLEVDDVGWAEDAEPLLDAAEGDVELPAGVYQLSARARLPDGARLQAAVGGVRVQARWTGEYLGELTLGLGATLPNGAPLFLQCVGPLRLVASMDGRRADVEDGSCAIDAFGQSAQGTYEVDIVVYDAGLVRGTVRFAVDSPLGSVDVPIEWAGAFYDDRFSGGLGGSVELPFIGEGEISGSLMAQRVNPYVEPDEE